MVSQNQDLAARRQGRRRLGLLVVLMSAGLLVAGGALWMLVGAGDVVESMIERTRSSTAADETGAAATPLLEGSPKYTMNDISLAIRREDSIHFVTVRLVIELQNNLDVGRLADYEPKLSEATTRLLRELSESELQGSAGIYRLKKELLYRFRRIIEPIEMNDLTFAVLRVE